MYLNRTDAGRQLAQLVVSRASDYGLLDEDLLVVGLPRGGLPVAYEVATELRAPLDVILVRKLGVPFQPEVAMGAIGEGNVRVLNAEVLRMAGTTDAELDAVEHRERAELTRRSTLYRSGRDRVPLAGRVVVIVDDGIATGSTAKAACQVARAEGASKVVLAVPVAPPDWADRLGADADVLITLAAPPSFHSVGQFYRDFSQTTDNQVIDYLNRAASIDGSSREHHQDVVIEIGGSQLAGHLTIPSQPNGLVVFAHGSGSSHHSPRNRFVASVLNRSGLATLLFDLLTQSEEVDRANVFDVDLLAARLAEATGYIRRFSGLQGLPVGYFGASTGAAAALRAAAVPNADVGAVVSRGGRPDLAGDTLATVRAPTLLIVGGADAQVLLVNQQAQAHLKCTSQLEIIPDAGHLFEEPGTLDAVANAAAGWFRTHLVASAHDRSTH